MSAQRRGVSALVVFTRRVPRPLLAAFRCRVGLAVLACYPALRCLGGLFRPRLPLATVGPDRAQSLLSRLRSNRLDNCLNSNLRLGRLIKIQSRTILSHL